MSDRLVSRGFTVKFNKNLQLMLHWELFGLGCLQFWVWNFEFYSLCVLSSCTAWEKIYMVPIIFAFYNYTCLKFCISLSRLSQDSQNFDFDSHISDRSFIHIYAIFCPPYLFYISKIVKLNYIGIGVYLFIFISDAKTRLWCNLYLIVIHWILSYFLHFVGFFDAEMGIFGMYIV